MKKKMQINKKKEERRGTQEKMSKVEKTARPAKAEKPIKATRPANAEKPIKSAERADAVCPYAKKCGGCDYQACHMRSSSKRSRHMCRSRSETFAKCCRFWGWTSRIITGTRCTPCLILKKSVAAVPEPVETVKLQMESRETAKTED